MKKLNIAINGFGRIGRAFYKASMGREEINIVAINDLGDIENLAYLLEYDTAYGVSEFEVSTKDGNLIIDGKEIKVVQERNPEDLPWGELKIDVVVESTGIFTTYEKANMHLTAGAKKVVISAPAKGEPVEGVVGATVLMGINEEQLNTCQISSNGSCTTNASSPLMAILDESIGVEKAMLNTIHGYTSTQPIVDGPNKKDFRKGRAGAMNIIPTSTGAATAVTQALPKFEGKFDGIAVRVPVIAGSIADITFISKKKTTVEEVNKALKKASEDPKWANIFGITEDPIVSSDILGSPLASIADLAMTRVVDGNLVKVMGWYDNEMGYTHTLVDHVIKTGASL
ncbi:MAG: glyceraldehyde 3-phosphate dehydrogenase [Candidatus Paceibacteria bacterium]|jgi:glyceraldehyde 3-phosphate dehydrogenase